MTEIDYLILDVFTDTQFEGNPLAVVIDPPALSAPLMQRIAAEFNLSETIFLTSSGAGRWSTRIFTPSGELPFAGHPTVGGAVALAESGLLDRTGDVAHVVFAEVAGDVPITVQFAGESVVSAQFVAPNPARPVGDPIGGTVAQAILNALGLSAADAHPDLDVGVWSAGVPFTVIPLSSVDALGRARVQLADLESAIVAPAVGEFYLLAPAGDRHWRSRMFAPMLGIAEDPATGSAACAAAGLLATIEPDGPVPWVLEQGVEMGRRSLLHLSADVSGGATTSVRLAGGAVLVGEGTLRLRAVTPE